MYDHLYCVFSIFITYYNEKNNLCWAWSIIPQRIERFWMRNKFEIWCCATDKNHFKEILFVWYGHLVGSKLASPLRSCQIQLCKNNLQCYLTERQLWEFLKDLKCIRYQVWQTKMNTWFKNILWPWIFYLPTTFVLTTDVKEREWN